MFSKKKTECRVCGYRFTPEREARDRFTFTEPEQCSLNVDPDTGEVVEESEVAHDEQGASIL